MKSIFKKHPRIYIAIATILGAFTVITVIILISIYLITSFIIWDWFNPDWNLWGRILRAWYVVVSIITALLVLPESEENKE